MKKNVTLKELNANGQLICQFKEVAYVRTSIGRRPFLHGYNPTTCYLHYYRDKYYVTDHIISTRQEFFDDYEKALYLFRYLVNTF